MNDSAIYQTIKDAEHLRDEKRWAELLELCDKALRLIPRSDYFAHWFLATKAKAQAGLGCQAAAYRNAEKAVQAEPGCVYSVWTLMSIGEQIASEKPYSNHGNDTLLQCRKFLRRSPESIAAHPCSDGITVRAAKGLLNDCKFLLGFIYMARNRPKLARKYFEEYLEARKHISGDFTVGEAREALASVNGKS